MKLIRTVRFLLEHMYVVELYEGTSYSYSLYYHVCV